MTRTERLMSEVEWEGRIAPPCEPCGTWVYSVRARLGSHWAVMVLPPTPTDLEIRQLLFTMHMMFVSRLEAL